MVNHSRASKPAPQTPKSMDAALRRRLAQQGRHGLLDLSSLNLTTLPLDIQPQGSQPVVALLLGKNGLSSLPPDFATQFPSLVWLDLSNNNFRPGGIPKSIANIESLQLVDLGGNPEFQRLPAFFAGSQTTVLLASRTNEEDETSEDDSMEEGDSEGEKEDYSMAEGENELQKDDFEDADYYEQFEWTESDEDGEPDSVSDGKTYYVSGQTSPQTVSTPRTESKRTARLRRKGKLPRKELDDGAEVLSEGGRDGSETSLSFLSASPFRSEARAFFKHFRLQSHLSDSAEDGFRQLVADHDEDFAWYLVHRYRKRAEQQALVHRYRKRAEQQALSPLEMARELAKQKAKNVQKFYDHKDKERSLKVGIGRDRGLKYAATHAIED